MALGGFDSFGRNQRPPLDPMMVFNELVTKLCFVQSLRLSKHNITKLSDTIATFQQAMAPGLLFTRKSESSLKKDK